MQNWADWKFSGAFVSAHPFYLHDSPETNKKEAKNGNPKVFPFISDFLSFIMWQKFSRFSPHGGCRPDDGWRLSSASNHQPERNQIKRNKKETFPINYWWRRRKFGAFSSAIKWNADFGRWVWNLSARRNFVVGAEVELKVSVEDDNKTSSKFH